jgi:hypothetical protein
MQQYRLREAMVGVSRDADGHVTIITLPIGSILAIVALDVHSGLVDATWADDTIAVFAQDLKARGDLVRTTVA